MTEKTLKRRKNNCWKLYDEDGYFYLETCNIDTLIHFLEAEGATGVSLSLNGKMIGITVSGENGCVLFEKVRSKFQSSPRKRVIESLKKHPKGMNRAHRKVIEDCLRGYFNLWD